jgi:hypothetical protein
MWIRWIRIRNTAILSVVGGRLSLRLTRDVDGPGEHDAGVSGEELARLPGPEPHQDARPHVQVVERGKARQVLGKGSKAVKISAS